METDDFYKAKRKEIKEKKRALKNVHFESSNERKSAVESIKREYRANKRSERAAIKRNLKDEYGL